MRGRGSSIGVLAALFAATFFVFQGFEVFDWESGVARFFLLLGIGLLCATMRVIGTHRRPLFAPPSRLLVRLAVAGVTILTAFRLLSGLDAALDVSRGGPVAGDQGPNIHAALQLVKAGHNPYGPTAVVDIVELESLVTSRDASRCLDRAAPDYMAEMKRFYTTFDVSLMPRLDVASSPECASLSTRADALGFKYGPIMIATHAPGLGVDGAAGMQWTNLALFVLLVALLATIASRYSRGSARAVVAALACAIVVAPTIVLRCTLLATDADLLPTVLGLAALWCLELRRARLGAVLVALSLGTKLLPGLLFAPLLLPTAARRSRAAFGVLAGVVIAIYLPFAIWDAQGLWANSGRFNFVRASDSTSIVHFVPDVVSTAMLVAVVIGLALMYRRLARREWSVRSRLDFLVAAHLGVLATGPILHNNYLVWLLPIVALQLANEIGGWFDTVAEGEPPPVESWSIDARVVGRT